MIGGNPAIVKKRNITRYINSKKNEYIFNLRLKHIGDFGIIVGHNILNNYLTCGKGCVLLYSAETQIVTPPPHHYYRFGYKCQQ
jgi:hypothetical protein